MNSGRRSDKMSDLEKYEVDLRDIDVDLAVKRGGLYSAKNPRDFILRFESLQDTSVHLLSGMKSNRLYGTFILVSKVPVFTYISVLMLVFIMNEFRHVAITQRRRSSIYLDPMPMIYVPFMVMILAINVAGLKLSDVIQHCDFLLLIFIIPVFLCWPFVLFRKIRNGSPLTNSNLTAAFLFSPLILIANYISNTKLITILKYSSGPILMILFWRLLDLLNSLHFLGTFMYVMMIIALLIIIMRMIFRPLRDFYIYSHALRSQCLVQDMLSSLLLYNTSVFQNKMIYRLKKRLKHEPSSMTVDEFRTFIDDNISKLDIPLRDRLLQVYDDLLRT